MALDAAAVQTYYAQLLRDFHYDRYLAYRGYTDTGEAREGDDNDGYPRDDELSAEATRVQPDALPTAAREAYEFYHKHFTEEDIGSVRNYRVPVDGVITYAVRTTTDGDDGYLEVFDELGETLGTGRTYIDCVAWGSRDWLRDQVANYGEFPPEMREAMKECCWGKPLPWDCKVACWQCQALGQVGVCMCKAGHRQESGDLHRCNNGHEWDDTPPDPRIFARPKFTLRLRDGRAMEGTLTDYKMTFQTRLGPITVFAADLKKIEFAPVNSHDDTSRLGLAIHRLGSDSAEERANAEAELLELGPRAFSALVGVAHLGNDDLHQRARALAARIAKDAPAEFLSLRKKHRVTTTDAVFSAMLPADTFDFHLITSAGYESAPLADVHMLTQLPGTAVEVPRPDPGWLARGYADWFGARLTFVVTGVSDAGVFGTRIYTLDSSLAAAAVHAGLVQVGETKVVRVEIIPSPARFAGSAQHGVESLDWEEPAIGAFRFIE
ncbi:MAG TPA: LCCL domain-containing protein [Gemmataceae bacterium]|nr:LCCL domain-containing protein [Gemmataceae bacterium]